MRYGDWQLSISLQLKLYTVTDCDAQAQHL